MRRWFGSPWWVVFASVCGLLVSEGPVNVFAMAVFLKPVTEGLGLGRGTFASALLVRAAFTAAACPLLGWLIDRWSLRRVMIPGLLLYAIVTAGYALIPASPFLLICLIFAVAGVIASCQTPIPYATATAQWFDRRRGLALGVALAGVGLGVAASPPLAAMLIGRVGWRLAFVGLAIIVLLVSFVPVATFLREPAQRAGANRARADALPGSTAGEAFRTRLFWLLGGAFFCSVIAINGSLTHLVALLTDRGLATESATAALSTAGVALILGRVVSGWCLDRFSGPYVATAFVLLPMSGIAALASAAGGAVPFLAAAACGLGIGAELGLMAFFASRYFGLSSYAKIYGALFAMFEVGVGPALAGVSFDLFRSYVPVLALYESLLAASCLIYLRLGPYPYPAPAPAPAETALKAAV